MPNNISIALLAVFLLASTLHVCGFVGPRIDTQHHRTQGSTSSVPKHAIIFSQGCNNAGAAAESSPSSIICPLLNPPADFTCTAEFAMG